MTTTAKHRSSLPADEAPRSVMSGPAGGAASSAVRKKTALTPAERHLEEKLDNAGRDSFPASDPMVWI